MRTPGPEGASKAVSVPPEGRVEPSAAIVSMFTRACTANPRGEGASSRERPSPASVSPAASRNWSCTRSTPVTSSVTVCSTWRRAFVSMNQNSPSASSPASTMNSKVPRLR